MTHTGLINLRPDQTDNLAREFLKDLEQLVNIDSGTFDRKGIGQLARVMQSLLEIERAQVQVYEHETYGPTLVARKKGSGRGRILMAGHMDTVFPTGTVSQRPFRIEGSRAYGPAVIDMKAGLLLGVYAYRLLRLTGEDSFEEICFLCNPDEEVGSPSSRPHIERLARNADAALILEAARKSGAIVSQRMGNGTYEIRVTGRAAHAGLEPWYGRNAILELAHKIVALNKEIPGALINVGVVSGGNRPNVVAEYAEAQVDVRVADQYATEEIGRLFDELVLSSSRDGLVCDVVGGLLRPPFVSNISTQKLVELANEITRELGFEICDESTGASSDGNFTAAVGTPTLDGLGPVGGHAHSPDEYLDIDTIIPRLLLLVNLIRRICRDSRNT